MLGGIQEDQFENLILEAGRIHDLVQKCFIEAIGENHPIYKSILCGDKLKVVCGNLANFKKIFTINFDLILYWLIMDMNKKGLGFQYKDKFNVNCGKYANMFDVNIKAFHEWNFMYLHGGIHLLKNIEDSDVLKLKNNNKFGNILEMYNKMKKKSKYESHLVFGKTSADKRSIIANSPYLTMAMNQLKNHDGELIVYGCKPCIDNDFNDQHLWENIIYSNIKKLYLGLVSKKDEEKTKKYIECRNSKIEISFFDIVEINIWRDVGFIDAIIA